VHKWWSLVGKDLSPTVNVQSIFIYLNVIIFGSVVARYVRSLVYHTVAYLPLKHQQ